MRYNIIFYSILSVFFCIGCGSTTEQAIDTFDTVKKVVDFDTVYSDKETLMGRVAEIRMADNLIVLKHTKDEYAFSFIDANTGRVVGRWGEVGGGPNELVQIGSGFTISHNQLVFLELSAKEIWYVSIPDILNKKDDPVSIKREPYPSTADFRPRRLALFTDKKVLSGAFNKGCFGVIDSNNAIIPLNIEYPYSHDKVRGIYRGNVFQSDIKSNPKHDKFVHYTFSSDIFEIYASDNDTIQRQFVSTFRHVPQLTEKGGRYAIDSKNSIVGLTNLSVSDDRICFTYSSESLENAHLLEYASDVVLCFDWSGNKIKKYLLPFPISNLCIDKESLYGIRYFEDELVIYRFRL